MGKRGKISQIRDKRENIEALYERLKMRLLAEKAKLWPKVTSNVVLKMGNQKLVFWSIATQNSL